MLITPAYAAIFALFYVGLSLRTLRLRRKHGIGMGDGGEILLARAVRVHANFSEYVPIALLLISFWERQGSGPIWVHILATLLLIGRIAHAVGMSQVNENGLLRVIGMVLTLNIIMLTSILLLISYIF